MSDHEFSAVYRTPIGHLADLPGELLLGFLATCSPRVKDHLLSKWLGCLAG